MTPLLGDPDEEYGGEVCYRCGLPVEAHEPHDAYPGFVFCVDGGSIREPTARNKLKSWARTKDNDFEDQIYVGKNITIADVKGWIIESGIG